MDGLSAAPARSLALAGTPGLVGADGRLHELTWRDGALLAWLALEGPTPRARLAALLWPDSDADAARNSLRQRLFKLRRLAGADLVVGSELLALAPGLAHDLADADGVLGELALDGAAELQLWLDQQRDGRRQRARRALVELCEQAEAAKDWDDALVHARELLALAPLSEEAHRRLMRLHYLAGDRAAALLAFDRCERVLKDEVGTAPSPETLQLLATIEAAGADPAAAPVPARLSAAVSRPPRLIGREAAWQALAAAWHDHALVLVTGEGGLGKSRLVGDFARHVGAALVVSARPGDERAAYASVSRLLRALPADTLAALDAPVQAELARLLPELGTSPPQGGLQKAADRTRFFNAVAAALDAPAAGLAGVVFDDLHFADDASVELLQFVVFATRVRWCVTARAAEVSADGRRLLDAFAEHGELRRVTLEPLTLPQVAELVDSLALDRLDGATVAPALWRHAGGNPLFLLETIKAWLEAAADGAAPAAALPAVAHVGQLIQRRLGRLSPDAVQLARCAAIAAPDFSVELAAQVLGLRPLQLADPWAELEAAQVLRPDGQFVHDLIHEAARASVPRAVARHLHGEIAAFLVAHGADPGRTAPHWALAGRWPPAAEAFERAAQQAGDAGRVAERCARLADAARCWGEAGDATRRFDTLLQRALTLVPNDSGEAALQALDEAAAAAQTDPERLKVQAARLDLAVSRFDVDEALRLAPPALEQARALGDGELVRQLSIVYAAALGDARRTAEGVRVLEPLAGVMHRRADDAPKWEFFEAFALALDYDGRLRSAAAQWQECQRLSRVMQRTDLLWRSLSNGAASLGKLGRMAEAVELSAQAWQLARTLGETGRVRLLQMQLPHAGRLRDVGRYAEALPLLEECLDGLRAEGSATDAALAEQRLAVLFLQLGQPARAVPLLAQDRERVPPGVRLFHRVLQAEVARLTGGDALGPMRDALALVPNRDDIFHRMACLYATAVLPDDEADHEAEDLVAWAAARERQGLELAARVRAAGTALHRADTARALQHVQAARELVAQYRPDSFYVGELWLTGARVFDALGRAEDAEACAREGAQFVHALAAQVPPAFVQSFLQRNPVNRDLLARAGRAR